MRTPMNTSVLIVGAGPVGLTLACELTHYQVPVRIVDKAAQRADKSKAIVIWSRTLELLDRRDQGSAPFVQAGFKVGASILLRRKAKSSVTSKWMRWRARIVTR
jgi:2-polyprenyl-6-methoxyphenol hydroxylase-like FAD-dependent oxidoreductase